MKNVFLILMGILMLGFVSFTPKSDKKHLPANHKTVALAEWENLRFGAFVHFNDNTCLVREFSKNTDPGIFNPVNLDFVKDNITDAVAKYLLQKTAKRPMVIPVILTI